MQPRRIVLRAPSMNTSQMMKNSVNESQILNTSMNNSVNTSSVMSGTNGRAETVKTNIPIRMRGSSQVLRQPPPGEQKRIINVIGNENYSSGFQKRRIS